MREIRRRRGLIAAACAAGGLAIAAVWWLAPGIGRVKPVPPAGPPGTLAVLPFESLDPDSNSIYLGIGLADSLIDYLSRVEGLTVPPMSATLPAAAGFRQPVDAARALHVSAALVGTYVLQGERLDVGVRLVETGTGATLWEHRFDTTLKDLLQIENEVVDATLTRLLPRLGAGRRDLGGPGRPVDATARYLYLLARGKLTTHASGIQEEAVRLLERAVALEPGYAAAQAALSEASANMFLGGVSPDAAWLDRALASGRKAVLLDEKDPAAHWSLGYALIFSGDPVGAARENIRALQLDPRHTASVRQLGRLLCGAGAVGPARVLAERNRALDPTWEGGWLEASLAAEEGTVEAAEGIFQRQLERRRTAGRSIEYPIMQLGYLAFERGDAVNGLRWAAMLEEASASPVYAEIIRLLALARSGDGAAVRRVLDEHRSYYERDWQYSFWIARALMLTGDSEGALTWLENSSRLGCYDLSMLERCPELSALRGRPRYLALRAAVAARAQEILRLGSAAGYL